MKSVKDTEAAVAAMTPGGRYEVRIVESHALLLIFSEGQSAPAAAMKLSADQANALAEILRNAAQTLLKRDVS